MGPSLLVVLFILHLSLSSSSFGSPDSSPLELLHEEESLQTLRLFKDELQIFRKEMTESFIAEHSRKKREILGFTYEVSLDTSSENVFESRTESVGYSSVIYNNKTYVFQANGIYELKGLRESSHESTGSKPSLVKVTSWQLDRGERVLSAFQWGNKLFILTSNQNGSYSKVYTVQTPDYALILRQDIRNQGYATSAKFFSHANNLFLIISTDNSVHSLTITPVYRWSSTYMDQIHEIQTKGASAVEAFAFGSFTYIAIAQAQDAAGNYEVGTLILRMHGQAELEKVQLLWSIEPVSLVYVRVLEEDFLIVGQNRESSIAYWFGGYDFLFWQNLDGLQGKSLYLNSLVLPDKEPLLLAATDTNVFLYTRIGNSQLGESLVLNRTSIVFSTSSGQKIVEARFLKTFNDRDTTSPLVYLALTLQSFSGFQLRVYPLNLIKKDIPKSQYNEVDHLGSCMLSLKELLDIDEPSLLNLESAQTSILTKAGDWDYRGSLISQSSAVFDAQRSAVEIAIIRPDLDDPADQYKYSPSATLGLINERISDFGGSIGGKLGQVLLKSTSSDITGTLTFTKNLTIQNLDLPGKLQLDDLNGVAWSSLENDVLRSDSSRGQVVRGNWDIGTLKAESIQTGNKIGNSLITDFLLQSCERPDFIVNLQGDYVFNQNLEFTKGITLGSSATINSIPFSNIALRSQRVSDIRGYKQADYVKGGEELTILTLNGLKLSEWYNSVLKTTGEKQFSSGIKTFTGELVIDSLQVQFLNGRNWNDFNETAFLNGRNQTLNGDFKCGRLRANALEVESINGKFIRDWMTTSTNQEIKSDIHVGDLKIKRNLFTKSINGIQLSDAVLSTDKNVEIRGPVQLQRFTVGNLTLPNFVTINGIDISEAAKLRKKHIYSTANGEDIYLEGTFQVGNLESVSLNEIRFESIRDAYWRVDIDNQIQNDFSFGSNEVVIQNEFSTGTLNGLDLSQDVITTTQNQQVISGGVQFLADVVVQGNVLMAEGRTLNEIDFSEVQRAIVRTTDENRRIGGKKTFQDGIEANGGIQVQRVNGLNLETDLVFLSKFGTQEIRGAKKFQAVISEEISSEVDVEVSGTVNGYKLDHVSASTAFYLNESIRIDSDVVFQQFLAADDLYVKNKINNIRFSEIVLHVISLDQAQVLNIALTIVGGALRFSQESIVASVNGVLLQEYLPKIANKYTDIKFTGTKEFRNVIVDGNLECSVINNINLTDLEAYAFSKTKTQIVLGKFVFAEVQSNGNLVTERIDGILISDFIRTDEKSTINSDIIFRNKETKVEGKIFLNGLLNNYKIEEPEVELHEWQISDNYLQTGTERSRINLRYFGSPHCPSPNVAGPIVEALLSQKPVAEGLKSLKGNRRFESILVEGNLSWLFSREDLRKLSYVLKYAVTLDTPQTLTQKITFSEGFRANTIQTDKLINNVDLVFIQDDAVYKNKPVIFKGVISFEHGIEVTRGSVVVHHHLNTIQINDIVLRDLYQQVVRIKSTQKIRGVKVFQNGVSADRLVVYGTIDGIYPKELVTINDTRTIDKLTLTDVTILNNLDYQRFEGFQFPSQRITLNDNQRIRGDINIQGDVIVRDCSVNSINGLLISDLFRANSESRQILTGRKTFTDLKIEGSLEHTSINGVFLDQIANQILRRDKDEIITRHVIFTDTVRLLEFVNVTGDINNYSIDEVAEAFTSGLEIIIQNITASAATKQKSTELILGLQSTQEAKAVWLDYLRVRQEWQGLGPKSRVEHIIQTDDSSVTIALHQPTDGTQAGLPQGCFCNSIQFLELNQDFVARKLASVNCVNIFDVRSPSSGSSYTVYSHPASYNQTCTKQESGSTYVSSMIAPEQRYRVEHGGSVPIAEFSLGKLETGYVSDVKAFSYHGKDYLVFAQYYDSKTRSHDTEVLVYETSNGNLRKVQAISSHGATRLALEYTDDIWTLVIGNSATDINEILCVTLSSIYHWSAQGSEFVLTREVQTAGLVDVSIVSIDKLGYFHEAFAAFAENGKTGKFGRVSIYRYNSQATSYFIYQTIETNGPISAIYAFSLPQFSYLVIVTPSNGLQFYHYLHAEGFKLQLTVPIVEAQDTNAIRWRNEIFFPIASTFGSLNAQAVIEGVIEPKPLPQLSFINALGAFTK